VDIMIDIETLSLSPRAAIVEIGAQAFDLATGKSGGGGFSVCVAAQSCIAFGGDIDQNTVKWWSTQTAGIPGSGALENSLSIVGALTQLQDFTHKVCKSDLSKLRIWANGAAFDITVLEYYFKAASLAVPWKYSQVRDARTVYKLAADLGWEWPKVYPHACFVPHRALDDCSLQIVALQSAYAWLRAQGA